MLRLKADFLDLKIIQKSKDAGFPVVISGFTSPYVGRREGYIEEVGMCGGTIRPSDYLVAPKLVTKGIIYILLENLS